MKRIKTLFAAAVLLCTAAGYAQAQDINAAIEAYNAGATAAQEENYSGALEQLNKAMEMATSLGDEGASVVTDCKGLIPQLYLRLAKEQAAAKDNETALATLATATEKAIAFGDQNGVADEAKELTSKVYMLIANEAFNAKDFKKALENYKNVIAADAENGAAYLRSGMASANLGMKEDAITALEKAKEFGQATNASKQLASLHLKEAVQAQKEKKWNDVYESAQKAVTENDSAQANKLLGIAAIELKKFPEALTAWEKVMNAAPDAKDINTTYYRLATTYEGLGQKGNACTYYKKILNDPNFKSVAEYKIKTELKCD